MTFTGFANRLVGSLGPDLTLSERVALFAAAASVGPSFEPGLQPRRTIDQAVATGVIAATALSGVSVTQSFIEAAGRAITRHRADGASGLARVAFAVGTNTAFAAAATGVARALPPKEDESSRRGLARTLAQRAAGVAVVGAGLSAAIGLGDVLSDASPRTRWIRRVPLALPAGVGYAAWKIHSVHKKAEEVGDDTIANVSTRNSIGIGIGVGAGVIGLQAGERGIAHLVAKGLNRVAPRYDAVANPAGHAVALALLGGILVGGYEYGIRRMEQGGAAVEPAYVDPPTSSAVSGGPGSDVSFDTLAREGRRFVNMVLTREEITSVMGTPAVADPIRVFVGLDSAGELAERVDLMMDELIRTGAFERDVLVFASPTGSGYINYVMAETVEYLTLGSSAICTMQYSMLPSFLSLDRTRLAIEQNQSLMHAITGYLRGMPETSRPKFLLFGESLGALTMQDVYRHRTIEAFERDFVHSSIFLGTPSATEFAKSWRLEPDRVDPHGTIIEVDNFGEYLDLDDDRRSRVRHALISHYDDPIPKFGTNLLMRRPWWLGPVDQRPPRVPKSTSWRPATTFVLTGVDLINAMEVVPGHFGRRGHDYREDIARFVSTIYDLPVTPTQLLTMERALRDRELQWAQRRVVSEQIARARESILREVKNWGINSDSGTPPAALIDQWISGDDPNAIAREEVIAT